MARGRRAGTDGIGDGLRNMRDWFDSAVTLMGRAIILILVATLVVVCGAFAVEMIRSVL